MVDLSVRVGDLRLKNPVVLASGTCGYGRELAKFINLKMVGAITVKGLSMEPWQGNPPPRIHEVYAGILNSIGLENKGLESFLREDLPFFETIETPLFVNIWGKNVKEYVLLARNLDAVERVTAIELNLSCPNVEKGGVSFALQEKVFEELVGRVRHSFTRKIIVKLGPQIFDLEKAIQILEREGIDFVSATNSFPGLAVNVDEQRFVFSRKVAGFSGPAIKPLALKLVYDIVSVTRLPVIGMGGIVCWRDALEFLLIGARAIGLGTVNLIYPDAAQRILKGIEEYLDQKGISSLEAIIGKVR
ncbi:dihydroorotate dehydrogenase [Thermatribacter velox]|uniref:Dihydroorotate dehydrogenase n=1 Tax=Thermatribacter velox TaxID=3039681 RepID=A0ABZ2YEV6_9BACT